MGVDIVGKRKTKMTSGVLAVPVKKLYPGMTARQRLFHATATPLVEQGEVITEDHLRALNAAGVKELYECEVEGDLQALAASTKKRSLPLAVVPVGTPVPYNIYDDQDRFLLRKGRKLSKEQLDRMLEAHIEHVYIDERTNLREIRLFDVELIKSRANRMEEKLQREGLRVEADKSVLAELFKKRPQAPRPGGHIERLERERREQELMTQDLLDTLEQGGIASDEVAEKVVKNIVRGLFRDVDLVLNFTGVEKDGEPADFRRHSLNVAALSVGVGLSLGYNEQRLVELGKAALLHEVGMLRVPRHIVEKNDKLDDEELQEIQAHPVFALEYLNRVRGLEESVVLAVYQEHESPDRTGYPNRRPAYLIHDFAKIIAVCDSYDAMTSPRPYRTLVQPYQAMAELIQAAAKLRYDPRVMRAFLRLLGLFPIGSWVKLSTGEFAKVIGGNYDRYDRPQVAALFSETPAKETQSTEDALKQNPVPLASPKVMNLGDATDVKIEDAPAGSFPVSFNEGF